MLPDVVTWCWLLGGIGFVEAGKWWGFYAECGKFTVAMFYAEYGKFSVEISRRLRFTFFSKTNSNLFVTVFLDKF